jgi:cytosine/adenosine deaminase-related metal-dependent hydrolase
MAAAILTADRRNDTVDVRSTPEWVDRPDHGVGMNQQRSGQQDAQPTVMLRIRAAGLLGPGVDALPPGGVVVHARIEHGPNPRAWIASVAPAGSPAGASAGGAKGEREGEAGDVVEVSRPDAVLMPALINAHAHLDLTHMGPMPADPLEPGSPASSFAAFGAHVLSNRLDNAEALRQSVAEGARRLLAGGVAVVGDIAGVWRTEPLAVLREAGLRGVSYLEVFGHGDRVGQSVARLEQIVEPLAARGELDRAGCRLGLSPHAPYSASARVYLACVALAEALDLPISTHLAECPEEREFVAAGTGPIRQLLERLGGVDEATRREFSHGLTPIAHLQRMLSPRFTVVHVNDCDDAGLEQLLASGAIVVYCPRASAYFAHERSFGPHRYQTMLERGVPVALGTDSIICLPEHESDRISPLDEARFLHRRDGVSPGLLMRMLYEHGARAMGVPAGQVELPGVGFVARDAGLPGWELLGLLAVDVRDTHAGSAGQRVMRAGSVPERLHAESR